MKRWAWLVAVFLLMALLGLSTRAAAGPSPQQTSPPPTVTGTPTGPIVRVSDWANVRAGPGVNYDLVGGLISGQTAPAVGISPGHEWIQIVYPGAPEDRGWVFAPLVQVEPAGASLPVVELPPTPTPRITATIDPTLAAQFQNLELAPTRLPTFTPAQPPVQPTFEQAVAGQVNGFPPMLAILGLVVVGGFGMLVSLLRGR